MVGEIQRAKINKLKNPLKRMFEHSNVVRAVHKAYRTKHESEKCVEAIKRKIEEVRASLARYDGAKMKQLLGQIDKLCTRFEDLEKERLEAIYEAAKEMVLELDDSRAGVQSVKAALASLSTIPDAKVRSAKNAPEQVVSLAPVRQFGNQAKSRVSKLREPTLARSSELWKMHQNIRERYTL